MDDKKNANSWNYQKLAILLKDEAMPCGVVDLDILKRNVERFEAIARTHGKTLRLATKSVRVPELIRMILDMGGKTFEGLMTFSAAETVFLASQGFDDFLIAYPIIQTQDLESIYRLTQEGKRVLLMVDEKSHLDAIESVWQNCGGGQPALICIDVDASYRPFSFLHLGVRRSPIRTPSQLRSLIKLVKPSIHHVVGLMAYEAQIAGLADRNPYSPLLNLPKSLIKWLSYRELKRRRVSFAKVMTDEGIALQIYNGGGSGSLALTSQEECVTEVTAGSGFLQSQLFDYYKDNINEPAFCFALRVTRKPDPDVVTCQSGGFIASGETGQDKNPKPFLPKGLKAFSSEGYGEVQTPLKVPHGTILNPGDPIFLRPAKAGEIAERFNEYFLLQNQKIKGRAKTYRGLGFTFY